MCSQWHVTYSVCLCLYLIPAVGSVRGVDEQGDDLGLGQEGSSSPRGLLWGEVVCALLKQEVRGNIRGHREKVHVPGATDTEKIEKKYKYTCTYSWNMPQTTTALHYCTLSTFFKVRYKFKSHQVIAPMCPSLCLYNEFSGWLRRRHQLCLHQLSNPFMGQFRRPHVCWLMFAGLKDHLEDVVEPSWTA